MLSGWGVPDIIGLHCCSFTFAWYNVMAESPIYIIACLFQHVCVHRSFRAENGEVVSGSTIPAVAMVVDTLFQQGHSICSLQKPRKSWLHAAVCMGRILWRENVTCTTNSTAEKVAPTPSPQQHEFFGQSLATKRRRTKGGDDGRRTGRCRPSATSASRRADRDIVEPDLSTVREVSSGVGDRWRHFWIFGVRSSCP